MCFACCHALQPLAYAIEVAPAECVAQCKSCSTIAYVVCAVGYLSLVVFIRVLDSEAVIPRVFGGGATAVPGLQLIWRGRGSAGGGGGGGRVEGGYEGRVGGGEGGGKAVKGLFRPD